MKKESWSVTYTVLEPDFGSRVAFKEEFYKSEEAAESRAATLKVLRNMRLRGHIYENIMVKFINNK